MASKETVAPHLPLASPSPASEAPPRSVELLNGGAEAFPRMLAAIRSAKQRIHLEVCGFERDEIGVAVAGQTVRVRLLDALGLLVVGFVRVLARWLAPRRLSK